MYFACDYPPPATAGHIVDELQIICTASLGKPIYIFALIDGAFDENFLSKHFRKGCLRMSLYKGTALDGFKNAAPFLVQISEPELMSTQWFEKFLKASGNRPMWSIIAATVDMRTLVQHFETYIIAKCDDTLDWPVRWADTRILPQLMNALEPEIICNLMRPIYSWFAISRTGELIRWNGKKELERTVPEYEKLPMSDVVFEKLIDASEADMVLSRVYETQPELLKLRLPSECHRLIDKQLKTADRWNIEQAAARQHFASISLFLRENFADMLEMRTLLDKVHKGADYMSEISLLPIVFWECAAISNG